MTLVPAAILCRDSAIHPFIDTVSIKDCTASNYSVTSGLETGKDEQISHDLIMVLS